MNYYVYCLMEEQTGRVRYIGITKNPKKRLVNHFREAFSHKTSFHKSNWIKKCFAENIDVRLYVVGGPFTLKRASYCEALLISLLATPFSLVNYAKGGIGVRSRIANRVADKMRKRAKRGWEKRHAEMIGREADADTLRWRYLQDRKGKPAQMPDFTVIHSKRRTDSYELWKGGKMVASGGRVKIGAALGRLLP